MHIVGLAGEIVGSADNLVQFDIAIIVVESLGYGLAGQIGLGVAPM